MGPGAHETPPAVRVRGRVQPTPPGAFHPGSATQPIPKGPPETIRQAQCGAVFVPWRRPARRFIGMTRAGLEADTGIATARPLPSGSAPQGIKDQDENTCRLRHRFRSAFTPPDAASSPGIGRVQAGTRAHRAAAVIDLPEKPYGSCRDAKTIRSSRRALPSMASPWPCLARRAVPPTAR
jgi:hypothetical protein